MAVLVCHLVLLAQQYCGQAVAQAVTKAVQPHQVALAVVVQADQTVLVEHKLTQL